MRTRSYGYRQSHCKLCNQPLVPRVSEAFPTRFAVSWLLHEEIAGPRSGHIIQNTSRFDYLCGLVATATANAIANSATSLWFVWCIRYPRHFAVSWLLHEAMARPKSGHFIQNASKSEQVGFHLHQLLYCRRAELKKVILPTI
jgi:hypothetical protein